MNYSEARKYLKNITEKKGMVFGLDTMRSLMKSLGNPEGFPAVHIAGTNGKGSVCTFTANILMAAGYTVGKYMSPAVGEELEIISINGENISEEDYAALFTKVTEAASESDISPTAFELETAVAFCYFSRKKCDICVIEAGLGGNLDATNVITGTKVAAFASIGMDHMHILGDAVEKITLDKAGIIKNDIIAVTQNDDENVLCILKEKCNLHNSELVSLKKPTEIRTKFNKSTFNYCEFENVVINQPGFYQIKNACEAIEIAKALNLKGFEINEKAVLEGLKTAKLPYRYETICEEPLIILDGAHNEDAAAKLSSNIKMQFNQKNIIFVVGIFKDKDYRKVITEMSTLACHKTYITITPDNPRALDSGELSKVISELDTESKVVDCKNVHNAAEYILQNTSKDDIIVAFGSLSYLKAFKDEFLRKASK